MNIRCKHPNAIWYHFTPLHVAHVALVNDRYRYEIREQSTGACVQRFGEYTTLPAAKAAVLKSFTVLDH